MSSTLFQVVKNIEIIINSNLLFVYLELRFYITFRYHYQLLDYYNKTVLLVKLVGLFMSTHYRIIVIA